MSWISELKSRTEMIYASISVSNAYWTSFIYIRTHAIYLLYTDLFVFFFFFGKVSDYIPGCWGITIKIKLNNLFVSFSKKKKKSLCHVLWHLYPCQIVVFKCSSLQLRCSSLMLLVLRRIQFLLLITLIWVNLAFVFLSWFWF